MLRRKPSKIKLQIEEVNEYLEHHVCILLISSCMYIINILKISEDLIALRGCAQRLNYLDLARHLTLFN